MQKNKNKKIHKHFKMSDEISDFFSSHKKIAVFIAVFITIILCVIVLVIIDNSNKKNFVFDQKFLDKQIKIESGFAYKKNMELILEDFRSQEISEESINSTLEDVLNLRVPNDYKEFHLDVVIYLEKENDVLNGNIAKDDAIAKWSEIVKKYNLLVEL